MIETSFPSEFTQSPQDVPPTSHLKDFFLGEDNCGYKLNHERETPSKFAYVILILMLCQLVNMTFKTISALMKANELRACVKGFALLNILLYSFIVYVFYSNLTNCRAWRGFFVGVLISAVFTIGTSVSCREFRPFMDFEVINLNSTKQGQYFV